MKIVDQILPGLMVLEPFRHTDNRGVFVKTFHQPQITRLGIDFSPVEEFYSRSHANVVRGMHFQLPPYDHAKLVYCVTGRVLDVLLDMRQNQPTFGQTATIELSAANQLQLLIPTGIAHGFLSLEDATTMIYKTSAVHSPSHDAGVRWDSFGYSWPVLAPLVSPRDAALPLFDTLRNVFA